MMKARTASGDLRTDFLFHNRVHLKMEDGGRFTPLFVITRATRRGNHVAVRSSETTKQTERPSGLPRGSFGDRETLAATPTHSTDRILRT
jgi:hypothetical protein